MELKAGVQWHVTWRNIPINILPHTRRLELTINPQTPEEYNPTITISDLNLGAAPNTRELIERYQEYLETDPIISFEVGWKQGRVGFYEYEPGIHKEITPFIQGLHFATTMADCLKSVYKGKPSKEFDFQSENVKEFIFTLTTNGTEATK